jgi:dTDP-4-amino-4,6-dideoxygalactose transaminase
MPPAIPLFKVFMAAEAHAALAPVLASGQLAAGRQVAEFEARFAAWLGAPEAVALADASGALLLALSLAGVGPGDEVLTSPLACSASLMPIANLFARPRWCDIDPDTGMPEAAHIAAQIGDHSRAILLYHWSGDVADLAGIASLAQQHGLPLVQDASEALGAQWQGRRLAAEADFTVYSFYASKPLTTGEGACLLAREAALAHQARQLRRFGIDPAKLRLANGDLNPAFDIPRAGYNLAMNEIAATLGLAQLAHAEWLVARHQANAAYYQSALAEVPGLRLLQRRADSLSAAWTYTLRAERRDALIAKLLAHGIGAQRLHLRNDAYSCFNSCFGGKAEDLPGVATFDAENLSLPCGWWVGDEDRERVVACLRSGW